VCVYTLVFSKVVAYVYLCVCTISLLREEKGKRKVENKNLSLLLARLVIQSLNKESNKLTVIKRPGRAF